MSDWIKPAKFQIGDIIVNMGYSEPEILEVTGYIYDKYVLKPIRTKYYSRGIPVEIEINWEQEEVESHCKLHTELMALKQFDRDLEALIKNEDT